MFDVSLDDSEGHAVYKKCNCDDQLQPLTR